MLKLLIVEDDPQTRQALADCVADRDDMTVLALAASVAEGLAGLAQGPDVVLVDLGLPDGSGEAVIRSAAARTPAPEVMVITVFGDERHVVSAIEAGASGYLLKDSDPATMVAAITDLVAGGSPITPVIARHILTRFKAAPGTAAPESGARRSGTAGGPSAEEGTPAVPDDTPQLTPRETEVLQLVARGYSNNEISSLLELSFHTVTSHIKHIYRKLSVRSRSEAVFEASQLGIIELQRPS